MNFYEVLDDAEKGQAYNPYASTINGDWHEGTISIAFLNEHFSHLEAVDEMINATESESLKKYFQWLKDEGILN